MATLKTTVKELKSLMNFTSLSGCDACEYCYSDSRTPSDMCKFWPGKAFKVDSSKRCDFFKDCSRDQT